MYAEPIKRKLRIHTSEKDKINLILILGGAIIFIEITPHIYKFIYNMQSKRKIISDFF